MIFVWPGRIPGGQRITQLVSMIDLLPTVLDLAGLPQPDVRQGQSLAPLMLGTEGWEARPVILDEFYVDAITGVRRGWIEVVDGRWGASLEINPHIEFTWRTRGEYVTAQRGERPGPLLLYDLWNDPHALRSVHEERPDLVDKYTAFLEAQWEAHQSLALLFSRPQEGPGLTTEQLETLRTLGYIR
jgi:arylsulfatase A-like enzyme